MTARTPVAAVSLALLALTSLVACSAEVEIETSPVTQTIPVTSALVPVYAEIAVDIPAEARGEVVVRDARVLAEVTNASTRATVQLAVWVNDEGEATPGTPYLFTELNRPERFARAAELLRAETFAPAQVKEVAIGGPALDEALRNERVWFTFRNTVTNVGPLGGLGEESFELRLEDVIFRARLTRDLDELTGIQELGGL